MSKKWHIRKGSSSLHGKLQPKIRHYVDAWFISLNLGLKFQVRCCSV